MLIGTGVDKPFVSSLRNSWNDRDLLSAAYGMDAKFMIGAKKNGVSLAEISTTGGILFSAKAKSVSNGAEIQIGDIYGTGFKNQIILRAQEISLTSIGKMAILGGTGSSLKTSSVRTDEIYLGGKDFKGYFNRLADFVVRVANQAGWTNVSDFKI